MWICYTFYTEKVRICYIFLSKRILHMENAMPGAWRVVSDAGVHPIENVFGDFIAVGFVEELMAGAGVETEAKVVIA